MKKNILWGIFLMFSILLISCNDDDTNIDKEKPVIDLSKGSFQNCITVQKGVPFVFTAEISDNEGIGSYGFNIHHNFDHHAHSTEAEVTECELDAKKEATNPFKLIKTIDLSKEMTKRYTINQEFTIPNEYQAGNYHFMLKVVDKNGWTTVKGLSFRVEEKKDDENAIVESLNSKIAKIHVMMHEGHLHGDNFHANLHGKKCPLTTRQDMVLVRKANVWTQVASEYKYNIENGKPFALMKTVNLKKEMKPKNPGGRHAFEFEFFDKEGNLLNGKYSKKAKNTQIFFTIDSYTNNNTKENVAANNNDESFFSYIYRDTNPYNGMHSRYDNGVTIRKDHIGMKGYFAIKKHQISFKINVHVVEWLNGEKPEGLGYNDLPTESSDITITSFKLPLNAIYHNEYDDYSKMFTALGAYYGLTAEQFEESFYPDFGGDNADYEM